MSGSALPLGVLLAFFDVPRPASAQTSQTLDPVTVAPATPRGTAAPAGNRPQGVPKRAKRAARQTLPKPPQPISNSEQPTPLNSNVVATSTNRLGLTVHETPATVEVISQQQMQEQGYRTTTETAQGAVGVLAGDAGGAPASFSMRGFSFGEVNVLYNGIWVGPGDITSRVMETANLQQVEFLKGPSSLMTGLNAIGGSVNYVSRQPTTGPIQNELDASFDSLGTYRTHYGSGGSTNISGLDYRFDVSSSKINSFIDGDYQQLGNVSG
ncbi:MAG: TonB-dependent receptor plug domain-containing protein, partial [Bradyrhizobium sp.]